MEHHRNTDDACRSDYSNTEIRLKTTWAVTSDLQSVKDIVVRFGDTYKEILAHAKKMDADLIIVASHRPHVSDFLLGTTAARIVRHATCSTLVVRQRNG